MKPVESETEVGEAAVKPKEAAKRKQEEGRDWECK
jgi:hypothetical protein